MYYYKFGEIYHHGIKGQKWGERNGPPYPLGSRKSGSERYYASKSGGKGSSEKTKSEKKGLSDTQKKALAGAAIAGVVLAGAAASTYIVYKNKEQLLRGGIKTINVGPQTYADFSSEHITIPAGTEFQRISGAQRENYDKGQYGLNNKRIFAAIDKVDKAIYMDKMPGIIKTQADDAKAAAYVHKQKAAKELRLASKQDLVGALDHNIFYLNESKLKDLGLDKMGIKDKNGYFDGAKVDHVLSRLFSSTERNKTIDDLAHDITRDLLKGRNGEKFDGVLDPNDTGWTKAPVILFDAADALGVTESEGKKLTKLDKIATVLRL